MYKGYMPVTKLNERLRGLMAEITARDNNDADILARLRKGIEQEIAQLRDENGDIAVHFDSDVTTVYDPDTPRAPA